jgi:MFS family permease
MQPTPAPTPAPTPWSPLRVGVFRALWIATVASNVGSWMHDVGASWMMTSLSPDPLMVALVQAAGSLPMFLFALPSGVMADIVDRRKYLLFAQLWMLVAAAVLGVLAIAGLVTPGVLLAATFALSIGAAMSAPPFQAIVPDLVPKAELPGAIALNSLGINISRAIGPALGGVILSLFGPPAVFLLNAVSVLGILAVLWRWKSEPVVKRLPPEHFLPAVRAGMRYVHAAPLLRAVMARAIAFFLFGSAAWALLPIIARRELGLGPGGYGGLLAAIGVGAIAGALLLPRLRTRLSADALTVAASLVFAGSTLALGLVRNPLVIAGVLLFSGFAWIAVLSTLNVGAQRSSAGWVKARALATYLTVFYGAMTAGSALWGKLAAMLGTPTSLIIASIGMALASATVLRWRLDMTPDLDLSPSAHLGEPLLADEPADDAGPVLITVEYQVLPADVPAFIRAVHGLRKVRRRGGALSWGIYEDSAEQGRFIETFVVESWLEHRRQHDRFTRNDQRIKQQVDALHVGPARPRVAHYVAPSGKPSERGAVHPTDRPGPVPAAH